MAEIKGIDVSRWNGNIDWKTVANYGMGFAILRITEKGNIVDSTFEPNYKGCIENKIPVGVYKYSYATTIAQIKDEANVVIKTLNKRKLDYPVFLDIEDKCQENLSDSLMMKMIEAFRAIIVKAGYCWVARYPNNDTGELQERLRVPASTGIIGWQYSSKATIPGIPTKTDRSVFYKDYSKSSTTSTNASNNNSNKTPQGSDTMNKEKAIDALIACAENEVGYLEKKSNSQLDDKTANAGYNNYTKYWRDVYPQYQAQAWCAAFVSWCMMKTFGLDVAKKLLKHWPYVYCPTLGNLFTKYANPQRGDIVIFYRNGTFAHTGLVTKVEGDKFYTIEGNTSGGSSIVPNGGGVYAKSYYNSNLPGTKFCRPDYSIVTSILTSNTSSTSSPAPVQPSYTAWVGSCTANGTDVFSGATGASKLSTYPKLNAGNLVDIIGESGTRYQVRIAAKYIGYVEKTNIKNPNTPAATTTKKYPFVGKVTASELNVRKKAGTEHPLLLEYPQLNKDNLVNVLGVTKDTKGDRWYKVSITKNEYVGYVSAKYITKA